MDHAAALRIRLLATIALVGGAACSSAGTKPAPEATAPEVSRTAEPPATTVEAPEATLPQIADSALGCTGEATATTGQCCVEAQCYTPEEGACPDSPPAAQRQAWGWALLGSGRCACSPGGAVISKVPSSGSPTKSSQVRRPLPIEGPFSSAGTDQDGSCCYTLGIASCSSAKDRYPTGPRKEGQAIPGRPLPIEGANRFAALVARSDWTHPALDAG